MKRAQFTIKHWLGFEALYTSISTCDGALRLNMN